MKSIPLFGATFLASTLAFSLAHASDTYQVTGSVLSITSTTIVVQKDSEKWEIAKEAATQVKGGEVKVGGKVTIKYHMVADSIEVKEDKK